MPTEAARFVRQVLVDFSGEGEFKIELPEHILPDVLEELRERHCILTNHGRGIYTILCPPPPEPLH